MKKPRFRQRFRSLPIFSGLLVLAAGGMYVRSYLRSDIAAVYTWSGCPQAIGSDQGRIYLFISRIQLNPEQAVTFDRIACSHEAFDDLLSRLRTNAPKILDKWGVDYGHAARGSIDPPEAWYTIASGPWWIPMGVAGLLFLRGLRRHLVHRRRWKRGLCLKCGYDLRESTGRCPECGTAIERQKNTVSEESPGSLLPGSDCGASSRS